MSWILIDPAALAGLLLSDPGLLELTGAAVNPTSTIPALAPRSICSALRWRRLP